MRTQKKRKTIFEIGDEVKIINPDMHYPEYRRWFDLYAKELKNRFSMLNGRELDNIDNTNYYVLAKGEHEWTNDMVYAISRTKHRGKVILISENGIERFKEE